ncbi:MAG TPA: ATP-binding protein [Thermoanaerobaculia bacterium]|nr:ATP-binding protein [Thermoanaerobaculia bacterium]
MKLSSRWFSRISIRLLAFHLLLVFLPIAGVLFLGAYEARLESGEVRDLTEQARIVAAAVSQGGVETFTRIVTARPTDVRLRLVDAHGNLLADSHRIVPQPAAAQSAGSKRHNTLYRIGAFLVRPVVKLLQPPQPPLDIDFYETATKLTGVEVRDALRGVEGFDKKITAGGKRSVTLYRAVPVIANGKVTGAVVASRNTFPILQDLYAIRLGVMRIFLASVVVAILVSLFFSATILAPLRQLRVDARSILDRRGRIRGHFKGSKRLDEIGELSRALERITRRLETHVHAIETFTADLSHEFKNPLASIRTANDMVADVVDPAVRKRFVQMIDQEVARMERLLSGVREISRIDAQLVREERVPVAIGELLTKIVEGFRLREGERVKFEVDVAGEPMVEASEDRLLQVFENLLDNAVSFSPDGGTVRVNVETSDGFVVTRVSDEGSGISEPHMNRIFDRFFTYRPDTSRKSHTGLGLAIVRAIVQGYGGTISAANAEKGASFDIRLPRAHR